MNEKLPKRSDDIYKEIESFEDYEYTNCIAYKMMIRNKEFYQDHLLFRNKSPIHFDKNGNKLLNEKYNHKEFIELIYNLTFKWGATGDILFNPFATPINNLFKSEITTTYHKNNKLFFDDELDEIEIKKTDNINVNVDYYFKTPELFTKNKFNIKINLNSPRDELIALISKIKDEYDKDNSIIKSPLELLGENLEKTDSKKINKKLIADKFFIYDYITAIQRQIKEANDLKYEEYEEQKQQIKDNPYLKSSERNTQLKELKREFEENTNIRKNELFQDIKDFKPATAKRYYYDIKPFIDDCKFKELIIGVKQDTK